MLTCARTIGGAGAGKTTRGVDIVQRVMDASGVDPMQIGYVSFTKAARHEAAIKAASKFNMPAEDLEKHGWFRTLHSCCYRLLGITKGELLTGSKDDNEWLRNVLGDEKAILASGNSEDDYFSIPAEANDCSRILALWDASRNKLVPVEILWNRAYDSDDRTPDLPEVHRIISAYEIAKKKEYRLDFCDMLMMFAGKKWTGNHDSPFADTEPMGEVPRLISWTHDEAQDMSHLTGLVFRRLIEPSQWAYLMGDSWQSVYSFAGSDGSVFSQWPVVKEEILPISYRCPSNILAAADQVMVLGGHKKRPFESSRKGGEVIYTGIEDAIESVRASEDTLIIARTNKYASHVTRALDDLLIPWRPTKGGGGFAAPARAAAVAALITLRKGGGITGEAVHRMLQVLPSKADGHVLWESGTKKFYEDNHKTAHTMVPLTLRDLDEAGGTEAMKELITSGNYKELLDAPVARMAAAAEIHGVEAIGNPKVRVGTIHSAKGMQAEHVVAINRLAYPTVKDIESSEEGMEEERRVWYVALSRASKKLTIAEGSGDTFPDL